MADLWQEFPHLAPSTIKRVLGSLQEKGLVASAGDESQAYINGMHWWSTASPVEEDPKLAAIVDAVGSALVGLSSSIDPHEGTVTVLLPLVEVESLLQGLPSRPVARIQACVEQLEESGHPVRLAVSTEIENDPEPRLAVKLRPATP